MADTQKKMTIDEAVKILKEAVEILKSDSYINYSVDELLEAVRLVKNDVVTRPDLLEEFYKGYYNQTLDETGVNYREFDKLQGIFAETEYAKDLQKTAEKKAEGVAKNLNEEKSEDFSFVEMDNIQALLAVVPQNNPVRSAQSKLNDMILAKMDAVIESKETVGIFELEAAQRLAENISNKEKKALAQKKLDEVLQSYEEENGLNQDVEVLRRNDKSLGEHLDNVRLYTDGKVSDEFQDLAGIIANVDMTEDDGTVLDADKRQRQLDMLFEAAKLEAYQENIGNIRYLMAPKKTQREQLVEKVQDLFVAKLGQAGIASTFERPTAEEQQDENKFKAYIKRRAEAANAFIERLAVGGQKLQLKVKDIITACADTDVEVTKFKDILEAKIGKGTSSLGKKLNAFRGKAVELWGKRYEISRNVIKSIKENKGQYIGNAVASTLMWGVTLYASAYALPAVAGYAVYSAAGGYVWPVVAEAQKMRKAAKEKGQKLGFWKSINEARLVKKEDKLYKNRARWGILGGIVGAAAGLGGFTMGVDTVAARAAAGLGRAASSMAAQTTALIWAKKDFRKNPTEENRSKLKAAKCSFGISAAISVVGAYFSLNRLGNANLDAVTGADRNLDQLGPVTGGPADWKDHMQMSTPLREGWGELPAEDAAGGVSGVAGTETVVPSVEDSFFPEHYDASMGITRAQYDNLLKLYSTEDLDRMYMNLSASGIMEQMDGMTKEEFIFKWSKLDAYTDRVRWDEKAQQYISIQGAKRYHFEDEMTDLNKMLNCGDKLELAQIEKIRVALGTIDDRGGYHGPGYVPTENYHVKGAGVDGPCAEGQENHFNRGGAAKVPEENPKPVSQPEPVSQPNPQPEPDQPEPDQPVEIEMMKVTYAAEPSAEAVYPSAFATRDTYPKVGDEGVRITATDKRGDGVTARLLRERNGEIELRLTNGDKVNLEITDRNGPSQQDCRHFNIRNPYSPVDGDTAAQAAEAIGGKPEEIISVTDKEGKTTYQYISNEGIKVIIDPQKKDMRIETLNETGAPYTIQKEAAGRAVEALNEQKNYKIEIKNFERPGESALTEVQTRVDRGTTITQYVRFSSSQRS